VNRRLVAAASVFAVALSGLAPSIAVAQADPSASVAPAQSIPAGPTITVTGVEYAYQGLPTSVPVGTTLQLTNGGAEVHEMVVFRKNDGVTETFEQLLQLPDDQALAKVTQIGGAFALPGQAGDAPVQVPQEGEYIALCFVPQGMTALPTGPVDASAAPTGTPHYLLGMVQTFTVTGAGSSPGPLPTAGAQPGASAAASPAG
jgi:hypothetical protein